MSDLFRATSLLKALSPEPLQWGRAIVIEGNPHSKARPRFTRNGRTYATAESKEWERYTADALRELTQKTLTGNLSLACIFFRSTRHRIDVDNMLKHVCDSANGVIWVDDAQVTGIAGLSEYDPAWPRTVVAIGPHVSTMERGSDSNYPCANCGKAIQRPGQPGLLRKTCSKECTYVIRGFESLAILVPCGFCKEPFRRRTSSQKFCSHECRLADLTGKKRASATPNSDCIDCGTTLAHKRGGRCRDCWRASVTGPRYEQPLRGADFPAKKKTS